jgi:hypothetical protein
MTIAAVPSKARSNRSSEGGVPQFEEIGDIVKVLEDWEQASVSAKGLMIPLFRDPKHWRARAAEAHARAEQFADPESQRLMFWIADEYEILAERADLDLDKLSSKNSN